MGPATALRRSLAAVTAVAATLWSPAPLSAEEEPARVRQQLAWQDRFEADIRPALMAACADCHQGGDAEGGFDLDKFDVGIKAYEAGRVWDRVAKRVARGEMPPEGSEPMPEPFKIQLADWAAQRPRRDACNVIASDETSNWYRGYVQGRRLTRAEYNNAVRDLTTLDLRPADDFPADAAGGEGFDTHGGTLYSSPILTEKLLAAADRVIEEAVPETVDEQTPPPRKLAYETLVVCTPEDMGDEEEAARRVVGTFATRAYRRPVADADLDRLLDLYRLGRADGGSFVTAVKTPLKAVLLSPQFLFVNETFEGDGGIARISPRQMAERLALFLWSGLPDAELLAVAEAGTIFEPHVLDEQVARMLAHENSRSLAENFGLQWLGLTDVPRPDAEAFPQFDDALAASMRFEVIATLDDSLSGRRPLTDLLHRDTLLVDARLAEHYGLPPVAGDDFTEVPAGGRGGVLTTAAVLTATSYPHRTSPVSRGKWVLETVLGERMPPPPGGVPSLEDHDAATPASLRERLEQHRRDPACAACHSRMDPLGFGLEAFDAVGSFREGTDTLGRLPDGRTFEGANGLKQVLLERREDFVRNLARKLLGYALGREVNEFDECVVEKAATRTLREDGSSVTLIREIVGSYPFQHRYYKK